MTHETAGCIFCEIVAGRAEVSLVHEDETVVAWMDLNPVVRGHLLVVPRRHAVGLEDLDVATGAHMWEVAHELSRTLRRSELRCDGINLLLCDGVVAFQTVFHVHLHVIPRHEGDGWTLNHTAHERARALLDEDARIVRDALERR
ncbi:histidine triad (HIT) protein [Cellulomonas flavigena DSM 20109]|uniref:Histidine triad (HIT) protein n=1 Tax=Cellulomonas flavigena (strain ATCC 482 / DSM 20109 / BCRC 11376 / JCM 18109 / NBRC 3775 / NCIMB 8073 / NRS 134) TaxID=446466 RepID=D5UH42_CELFN|nr:HIT domain-containing protein [Cellulomonas flavigena]ADG73245.1 histidine triad (HIT) protein [Cellulomonas flavigena DSM 20109]